MNLGISISRRITRVGGNLAVATGARWDVSTRVGHQHRRIRSPALQRRADGALRVEDRRVRGGSPST